MGKPLSRPDCLRQNPSCVGKAEEEDLNIDDCYVPQRSIYDTVRLNEQIDSGSKGSLSSRHLVGTLPYTHRTLDLASLCGNGVLASSSAFELRAREAGRFDERAVFDGLKLNGDVIRGAGTMVPKSRASGDRGKEQQPQHRRSWRTFAPTHLNEYASRSGTLSMDGGSDRDPRCLGLSHGGRGRSIGNSLTSEDDSGLCSPTAEREKRRQRAQRRVGPGTRSLSSTEAVHVSGELRPGKSLSSGQGEFPFSPAKEPLTTSSLHSDSLLPDSQQGRDLCVIDLSGVEHTLTNGDRTDSKGSMPSLPSGSGSRCGSGSSRRMCKDRRSRTFAGYEELPTAELLEDTLPQKDSELISVVVTQPEMCFNGQGEPLDHRLTEPDDKSYDLEKESSEYNIADIEDFLLEVANGVHPIFKHMGEEEIMSMLAAIAAMDTSQLDFTGLCPPQVSRESLEKTAPP